MLKHHDCAITGEPLRPGSEQDAAIAQTQSRGVSADVMPCPGVREVLSEDEVTSENASISVSRAMLARIRGLCYSR